MCNYYSIGVESRIGLGFDKRRTSSKVCNDVCYGWEGLKKLVCCYGQQRTHRIRELIHHVSTLNGDSETLLFAASEDSSKPGDHHYLTGNPVSLVCTNINSMMGGRTNVWASGRGKDLGLKDSQGKTLAHSDSKLKEHSSHDDDHLEFSTVQSVIRLALGSAQRVAQDKGPFVIKFREPMEFAKKHRVPQMVTYMQIDGEYYKVVNPDRVEIRLNPQFSRVKVLK